MLLWERGNKKKISWMESVLWYRGGPICKIISNFRSFWKNGYIGKTGRRPSDRFRAHLRDVERKDKDISKRKSGKTLEQKFIFQIGALLAAGLTRTPLPLKTTWPCLPSLPKKIGKKTGPLKWVSVSGLCEIRLISSLYAIRECRFYNEDYLNCLCGSMVIYAIIFINIFISIEFFPSLLWQSVLIV